MHAPMDHKAIAGAFRAGDSRRFSIDLKKNRDSIISSATAAAAAGFPAFGPVDKAVVKGRTCFSIPDYNQNLILRIVAKFIAQRFRVEMKNRDRTVKGVIEALSDATPLYILRRDISSFYETLPLDRIYKRLTHDVFIPTIVRQHLNCFFDTFCPDPKIGLPRGICISPVLAELAMEDFDKAVRRLPGVYKYFRYSDDILIFSFEPTASIELRLPTLLPSGMAFNPAKSTQLSLACDKKSHEQIVSIEYLGYSYRTSNLCGGKEPRRVTVGISDRKIGKLKTKIFCCFKQFQKDADFPLLYDRLRFLSGNYIVYRHGVGAVKSSKFVKSGIHYNYKLCGMYARGEIKPHPGNDLKSLDGFYQSLIRPGVALSAHLNPVQRQQLKALSFFKGFELKLMTRFHANQVTEIKRAWRNV